MLIDYVLRSQITNGVDTLSVTNGIPMLCDITAAGCSVTAMIAAYVAAKPDDPLIASAAALGIFGYAFLRLILVSCIGCTSRQRLLETCN